MSVNDLRAQESLDIAALLASRGQVSTAPTLSNDLLMNDGGSAGNFSPSSSMRSVNVNANNANNNNYSYSNPGSTGLRTSPSSLPSPSNNQSSSSRAAAAAAASGTPAAQSILRRIQHNIEGKLMLSPRLEATVQLMQEGVHDLTDNHYENETQAAAIANHKESLLDSSRRREEMKSRMEMDKEMMRAELYRVSQQLSSLQLRLKAAAEERDGAVKKMHDEKMKCVQAQHDLETSQEEAARLLSENEQLERDLGELRAAIEDRARQRQALRLKLQQLFAQMEFAARMNLVELEGEIRRGYITGGALSAGAAMRLFFQSKGKEGPPWMTEGARCYAMLLQRQLEQNGGSIDGVVPQWLVDAVVKHRQRSGCCAHKTTQTYETGESRDLDGKRSEGTIAALKQELASTQDEAREAKKEADKAKQARDAAKRELDAAKQREDSLNRTLRDVQRGDDAALKRLRGELEAREGREKALQGRIRDLEADIAHLRRGLDRERSARAEAVRTATWIEHLFQQLEDEERDRRRRILAAEAEEAASRLAPIAATLKHEAARLRRGIIETRSHLRSLTPPRSMSGVTGKRPWYPPPGPAHARAVQFHENAQKRAALSSSPARAAITSSPHKSDHNSRNGTPSPRTGSKSPQYHRSPSAFSRVNSARLAVSLEQMQTLLDDLQQYAPTSTNQLHARVAGALHSHELQRQQQREQQQQQQPLQEQKRRHVSPSASSSAARTSPARRATTPTATALRGATIRSAAYNNAAAYPTSSNLSDTLVRGRRPDVPPHSLAEQEKEEERVNSRRRQDEQEQSSSNAHPDAEYVQPRHRSSPRAASHNRSADLLVAGGARQQQQPQQARKLQEYDDGTIDSDRYRSSTAHTDTEEHDEDALVYGRKPTPAQLAASGSSSSDLYAQRHPKRLSDTRVMASTANGGNQYQQHQTLVLGPSSYSNNSSSGVSTARMEPYGAGGFLSSTSHASQQPAQLQQQQQQSLNQTVAPRRATSAGASASPRQQQQQRASVGNPSYDYDFPSESDDGSNGCSPRPNRPTPTYRR